MAKIKQSVQLSGDALLQKVKELEHLSKEEKLKPVDTQPSLKTIKLALT